MEHKVLKGVPVVFRLAKLEDHENIIQINDNVYDGFDYMHYYFEMFLQNNYVCVLCEDSSTKTIIAYIQGLLIDDNSYMVLEAVRVKADYQGLNVITHIRNYLWKTAKQLHPNLKPTVLMGSLNKSFATKEFYTNNPTYIFLSKRVKINKQKLETFRNTINYMYLESLENNKTEIEKKTRKEGFLEIKQNQTIAELHKPPGRFIIDFKLVSLVDSNIEYITSKACLAKNLPSYSMFNENAGLIMSFVNYIACPLGLRFMIDFYTEKHAKKHPEYNLDTLLQQLFQLTVRALNDNFTTSILEDLQNNNKSAGLIFSFDCENSQEPECCPECAPIEVKFREMIWSKFGNMLEIHKLDVPLLPYVICGKKCDEV